MNDGFDEVFSGVEYLGDEELEELVDGDLLREIRGRGLLKYVEEVRRRRVLLSIEDVEKIIKYLPQYVPVHVVTKLIGLSRKTIYRYIRDGKLKAIKSSTGRWLIPKEEIIKIFEQTSSIIKKELKNIENILSKLPKIEIDIKNDKNKYIIEIPKTLVSDVLGIDTKKIWIIKTQLHNQPILIITKRICNI